MKTRTCTILPELPKGSVKLKREVPVSFAASLLATLLAASPAALHAQTVAFSGAIQTVGSGFKFPTGVAVDSSGNVFVADTDNNAVKEIVAAGGYTTINILGSGFFEPTGVAVDGSGNVFVADSGNNAVKEIVAAGGYTTINTLGSGFNEPRSVAVDGSGNVFVADIGNNAVKEIVAAGGYTTVNILGSGFNEPRGVAVDGIGNIFVADYGNGEVKEIVAASGYATVNILGGGLFAPEGVAVDGTGNVFVLEFGYNAVREIVAVGGYTTVNTFGSGLNQSRGVAVDGSGNVFVADTGNSRVIEVQTQSVNFGRVNIASSASLTLNYSAGAGETLGTPNVLTQGAPNLDFTLASGSTCTGALTGGSSCTVNVTFSPKFAGPRNGAVQIVDGSGNVLATTYIHGIGVGPQVTFANTTSGVYLPSTQSTLGSGFDEPLLGIAVDGSGNVFLGDQDNNAVKEIVAAGGYTTVNTLGSGFSSPEGVAVDGSGNVFVADYGNNVVKEIVAAGGYTTVRTLGSGFNGPRSVALDGSGNVFVAVGDNNTVNEIVAVSGYTTVRTLGSGFNSPSSVAVDGSGNVFVADTGNNAVKEIVAAGGYTIVRTLGSGFNVPISVAVDGGGNVFVADTGNNAVKEIVAAGGYTTVHTLGSGFNIPHAVAVDGRGNVFVADTGNYRVEMLDYADPPRLSFAATNVNNTSSDSSQSVAIANIGNVTLSANAPGLTIGANFVQVAGSGTLADCTASFSLAPGTSCNLSISFTPKVSGSIQSSAVLTDNSLNGNPAMQIIALTGTGVALAQSIAFGPIPAQVQGTTVPLSASASSGLPVSFTSLTTTVCTVSGTSATLVNPGTCTIQASQPGSAQYAAATPVNQSFTVTPAASFTITPIPPAEVVYRERLGSVILKLQSVKGFNANVTLTCSGGPAGIKCADLPGTVHVNGTAYAISGVLFPANTPDGTYTITFTGVSGSLTNSTTAKFTVK